MQYEPLRRSKLAHRLVAATAIAFVFAAVAGAGVMTAHPPAQKDGSRYRFNYSVARIADGQILLRTRILDTATGQVIGEPSVTAKEGQKATLRVSRDDDGRLREFLIEMEPAQEGATVTMTVRHDGAIAQITRKSFIAPGTEAAPRFSGQPITLHLSKADIRDVLRVFSQLTGTTIEATPEVQGLVTVEAEQTPWDQAFDELVRNAGYAWRVEGSKIIVYQP